MTSSSTPPDGNDDGGSGRSDAVDDVDAVETPPIDEVIEAFLREVTVNDRAAFTTTADIMLAARIWCDGRQEFRFGRRLLAKKLASAGCVQQRTNARRGWRGVKLR